MKRKRMMDVDTLDLFDQALSAGQTLDVLRRWSDAGLLRRLDSALAAFVADSDASASPSLLVATAVLAHMEGRGHSCLPLLQLVQQPNAVLAWPSEAQPALQALWAQLPVDAAQWLQAFKASPVVRVLGRDADAGQPLVLSDAHDPGAALLYLRRYWDYERAVAAHVRERTLAPMASGSQDALTREWLQRLFPDPPDAALNWQKLACALALRGRFSVITGGPGTGKTYTAARLLALLFATSPDAGRLRVALAAPTGKAAARLKQSIDVSLAQLHDSVGDRLDLGALVERVGAARTLHSLLGARPDTRHWGFHAGRPLDVDVLIVDEASMVHLEMMSALLDALPPTARLVLLGDKDQLASVEAGAVLGDLCRDAQAGLYGADTRDYAQRVTGQAIPMAYAAGPNAEALPLAQHTVMLRESRRFGGPIGELAEAVNAGHQVQAQALLDQGNQQGADAQLAWQQGGPVQAVCRLAVRGRGIHPGYGAYAEQLQRWRDSSTRPHSEAEHQAWVTDVLRAFERFRLLCAVREGDWGVAGLNRAVEQALQAQGAIHKSGEWYAGRPIMVTRNDAGLGVFNGDIGMALPSAAPGNALRAFFLNGEVLRSVSVSRLAQVETAYAMTVHKSQGSEFEHTALVLSAAGANVLSRELVYTGITRARKAFSLLAQEPGLLAKAVVSPTQRASGLLRLLEPSAPTELLC